MSSGMSRGTTPPHDAAGAYVLGILDDADAAAFEAHLVTCDLCAAHVEEFAGMEPMLALLADAEAQGAPRPPGRDTYAGPPAGAGPSPGPYAGPWAGPYAGSSPGAYAGPSAGPYAGPPGHHGPPSADDVFDAFAPRPPAPSGPPGPRRAPVEAAAAPGPELLGRLIDEVGAKRAARRRRTFALVAAAAVLVVGGPAVAVVATSGGGHENRAVEPHPTSPAEDAFFHHMDEKLQATDPTTKVSATVGMEKKGWGTHTVLELKNVKGPLKCRLVAVSKSGEEETVTSWAVPKWGYGIPGATQESAKNPLYVHGGAAMDRGDIDHFEVRTFDGERLVEVEA
ncbi:zf-HC2 domain-containing protein [Streptomyces sp. NPDC090127]|uniref:zf-HC2 domain-containing protein n=1 Tax=Streptomyces sp. NPDC090127 TaxID=3365953 RepID=UPI0037F7B451